MTSDQQTLLQQLPSVTRLLEATSSNDELSQTPHSIVVDAIRATLASLRKEILAGNQSSIPSEELILKLAGETAAQRQSVSLRRVVNATGIVLHTGLGRAPLSDRAVSALQENATGYCNLEFDLESGQRGRRMDHVSARIARITGAEAAVVVNNNAAATLLVLQTFAAGKEVVVSRGELIEIGGSYRLPDIMRASGVTLREVGTTNRTRLSDYANAINEETGMLLKAHTSNYRVIGFTESTSMSELVSLGRERGVLTFDDIGSGALIDPAQFGFDDEPTVAASITSGADLICFSGDKLLGGPQCGIIVGSRELMKRVEKNPLMRTYRLDKLVLLALEATLAAYEDVQTAGASIPTLRMLAASTDELLARAQRLLEQLQSSLPDEEFLICSTTSFAGGGTLPQRAMDSVAVTWRPRSQSVTGCGKAMRLAPMPVISKIQEDAICFDLRTIADEEFDAIEAAIHAALQAE
ncbi:MAG: L-seryl-tRNA(Sec) selenium transferase [Phycisphaerae bacterium]